MARAQSDQLTLLFTDLKDSGFFIARMTFGLWLLPLGYSGQIQDRLRLNRGGDRQADSAPWRIAIVRLATDPDTRDYVQRRQTEGNSTAKT